MANDRFSQLKPRSACRLYAWIDGQLSVCAKVVVLKIFKTDMNKAREKEEGTTENTVVSDIAFPPFFRIKSMVHIISAYFS